MKVISLIASTLLIVLISQDSTLGLPVNNSTVPNSCPKGSQLIDGNCIPVDSTSNVSEVQSATIPAEGTTARQEKLVTENVSSEKNSTCPLGMERGKDGACSEIKSGQPMDVTTQLSLELTTELSPSRSIDSTSESVTQVTGVNGASNSGQNQDDCPEGTQRNTRGVCKPLKNSKMTKLTTQAMNDLTTEFASGLTTALPSDLTTELTADLTTALANDITIGFDTKSEDNLTTKPLTATTTGVYPTSSRGKNLKNCPRGMMRNKQGVCKLLTSFKLIKATTQSMNDLTTEFAADLTTEFAADLTTEFAAEQTPDVETTTRRAKNLKDCPAGMKRNQNGACRKVRSPVVSEVVTESTDGLTTSFNAESDIELTTERAVEQSADVETTTRRAKNLKSCPAGTKRNQQGVCKQVRSSTVSEVVTESTDDLTTSFDAESDIELTTERAVEQSADVETTTRRAKNLKSCPVGTKRNQQGVCKQIGSSTTVEDNTQVVDGLTTESTAEIDETSSQKKCPEGTVRDEQGACQKIKSSGPRKNVTNLKELLKKDGSCPANYKMIQGRCLYIKNKIVSNLFPIDSQSNGYAPVTIPPTSANGESYKVESVPVLSDNSCPEGSVYSEYGLCQKRVALPKANRPVSFNGRCQNNYELVNGQCLPRITKTQRKPTSTTPATDFVEGITIMAEDVDEKEAPQSTSTVQSTAEGSDM